MISITIFCMHNSPVFLWEFDTIIYRCKSLQIPSTKLIKSKKKDLCLYSFKKINQDQNSNENSRQKGNTLRGINSTEIERKLIRKYKYKRDEVIKILSIRGKNRHLHNCNGIQGSNQINSPILMVIKNILKHYFLDKNKIEEKAHSFIWFNSIREGEYNHKVFSSFFTFKGEKIGRKRGSHL